jgi:hypothetical protein
MSIYKQKYLKYKLKYLTLKNNLKNNLNLNLNGGGIESAKDLFFSKYKDVRANVRANIESDTILIEFIRNNYDSFMKKQSDKLVELEDELKRETENFDRQIEKLKNKPDILIKKQQIKETVLKNINDKIQDVIKLMLPLAQIFENPNVVYAFVVDYLLVNNIKCDVDNNIDFFIKCYLNNSMGKPNSISNFSLLLDSINAFKLLQINHDTDRDINSFNGFTGFTGFNDDKYLEHYLKQFESKLQEYKQIKMNKDDADRLGREGGIKVIEINSDNGSIVVYKIKTEKGGIYYGKGTKWCTAYTTASNFFELHSEDLYVIQIKNKDKQTIKYQLDAITGEFKDPIENMISFDDIIELTKNIDDGRFFNWLFNKSYVIDDNTLTIKLNILKHLDKISDLDKINEIIFDDFFNELLEGLIKVKNLRKIKFGEKFNKSLNNSFDGLTNLTHLKFGRDFNQELNNSLDTLTNLRVLIFGQEFNQELNNSLDKLTELTRLKFGNNFNQLLNNSLDQLTKLTHLVFGYNFKRHQSISPLILQNLKLLIILNPKNLYKIDDFRKRYNLSDDCKIELIKDDDNDFDDINDV